MEITVKDPTQEELEAHKKAGEEEKKENASLIVKVVRTSQKRPM